MIKNATAKMSALKKNYFKMLKFRYLIDASLIMCRTSALAFFFSERGGVVQGSARSLSGIVSPKSVFSGICLSGP